MLSVRLPRSLAHQLSAYCNSLKVTKSAVVQQALEKYLKIVAKPAKQFRLANPTRALRGTGNRKYTTEQIMRMTRGDD